MKYLLLVAFFGLTSCVNEKAIGTRKYYVYDSIGYYCETMKNNNLYDCVSYNGQSKQNVILNVANVTVRK